MSAHNKKSFTRTGIAFGLASLLGGGAAQANDWSSLGYDSGRARATDEKGGATFSPSWNANPAGSPIVSSLVVADGYVVVASKQGDVTALRAVDGTQVWNVPGAGSAAASPAVDRGLVFLPTLAGQLQTLHLSSGAQAWTQTFGGQNFSSPSIVDDSVGHSLVLAAGFPAQKIVRLATSTGASQWETPSGAIADLVGSSPAFANGRLAFGVNGGTMQTADVLTGAKGWTASLSGAVGLSSPLVVGTTSYLLPGGSATTLFAVDSATGAALPNWPVQVLDPAAPDAATVATNRNAVSSPALMGNLIVFVTRFEYDLKATSTPGRHLLHEVVVAIDPSKPGVAWQQEIGRLDAATLNEVPELNMSPTPVVFATDGNPLVAVASSLATTVRVYDLAGAEQWNASLSAPTRSSPVFANGLLLVATDAGTVHAFASNANHAPVVATTGFSPADGEMVEGPDATLKWAPATDAEGQALTYQVRLVAADGDLRDTWLQQYDAAAETSVVVAREQIKAGLTYRYAVRARDAFGAWSDWSTEKSFTMAIPAKIDVNGQSYDTLDDAIAAAAVAGGTVNVGRGLVHLHAPLALPAGVSIVGVGAQDTILDATGQVVGVQMKAAGKTGQSALKSLTVTGADVGVQVVDVQNAVLRNLVLRDNKKVGVQVEEGAVADAANLTITRNPTGASVSGKLGLRSSLVTGNDTGLARVGAGVVTSRYNDVAGNKTAGYDGVTVGTGDLAVDVTFRSTADFHLDGFQATTDMGDPADEYKLEPQPNGARVNMGAFGNTTTAELSRPVTGWTQAPASREVASTPSPVGDPTTSTPTSTGTGGGNAGCAVAGETPKHHGALGWLTVALSAVFAIRRRRK